MSHNVVIYSASLAARAKGLSCQEGSDPAPLAFDTCILEYFQERNVSLASRKLYTGVIRSYTKWAEGDSNDSWTAKSLSAYQQSLFLRLKPSSVNTSLAILKAFSIWLHRRLEIPEPNVRIVSKAKTPGQASKFLTDTEKQLLEESLASLSLRDQLIVHLLGHGLRAGCELVNLQVRDWDRLEALIYVRKGKNYDSRYVSLRPSTQQLLTAFLPEDLDPDSWLFGGREDKPLSYSRVYQLVQSLGQQIGIDLHPHRLRHTFCASALLSGLSPQTVMRASGHRSYQAFQVYVAAAEDQAAIAAFRRVQSPSLGG